MTTVMVCEGKLAGEHLNVSTEDAIASMALRGGSTLALSVEDPDQLRMIIDDPAAMVRFDGLKKYRATSIVGNRVTFHEIWTLLDYVYPTVGSTAYRVDSQRDEVPEYIVPALLEGTAWQMGTVDARTKCTLKTDLLSVLGNLRLLEEYSQAWLTFDSVKQTVSLRDDEKWQPDPGVELKASTLDRSVDLNIITEIAPFGRDEISIASHNQGRFELTENPYSLEKRQLAWKTLGISDRQTLKNQAERYLAKLSRPRVTFSGEVSPGKPLSLGDVVTVRDGYARIKTRVTALTFNIFESGKYGVKLEGVWSA